MTRLEGILGLAILVPTLALGPGAAWPSDASSVAEDAPPQAQAADTQPDTSGQWVYTQQYGWVWMPYGDDYSYVPPGGEGEPYEYVYYPDYGWTWIVAPWIWGFGPWPYFGVFGPAHFGWYGHGWWRSPWRWRYRPSPTHRWGFAVHGIRSAPARGAFVVRSAPSGRGLGQGSAGRGGGHGGGGGGGHGGRR
jgi:hypothetical protein